MKTESRSQLEALEKTPSGIAGLDEITGGGLPRGRPSLVCGGAGAGKTMLAMEFVVRGATQYNEPGVFVAFEETEEELAKNVKSLWWRSSLRMFWRCLPNAAMCWTLPQKRSFR